jgi:hypothetical protein
LPHIRVLRGLCSKIRGLRSTRLPFVAVDILTHHDGIRHSGFEGQSSSKSSGLLVLVACALQHLHMALAADSTIDIDTTADLDESLSFSKVRKRNPSSRFYSVLCDIISDKNTCLNCGGGGYPPHGGDVSICDFCPVHGRHDPHLPSKGSPSRVAKSQVSLLSRGALFLVSLLL